MRKGEIEDIHGFSPFIDELSFLIEAKRFEQEQLEWINLINIPNRLLVGSYSNYGSAVADRKAFLSKSEK